MRMECGGISVGGQDREGDEVTRIVSMGQIRIMTPFIVVIDIDYMDTLITITIILIFMRLL